MSNWISVEDELPDNFTWVLISVIFAGKLITTMAYFERQGDEMYWLAHNNLDKGDEWHDVIGWRHLPEPMPLPEPPKEGKQSRTHIPNGTTRVTNAATGESHIKIDGKFVKEVT